MVQEWNSISLYHDVEVWNFREKNSSLEIWAVWGTPLWVISWFLRYVLKIIISKLIKLDSNCQPFYCKSWYVIWLYSTFQFSQKVFLFISKLVRKGETAQLAWKKWTPFNKILMVKNHYFVVVHNSKDVLGPFYNF